MRDYPLIYLPVLNFFGAVIVVVEGVVKHSRGIIALGVFLGLICIVGAFGILFGARWR